MDSQRDLDSGPTPQVQVERMALGERQLNPIDQAAPAADLFLMVESILHLTVGVVTEEKDWDSVMVM
tara:strand:- start:314 stop:514 length:201 start_codon:yes stop_codon:yes gene_type:complete